MSATAESRARAVRAMFSAIAPTYDLLNRILSLGVDVGWRRQMVRRLPSGCRRVLDLACGTGDVALEIVRQRPAARVFGADFALPMLRAGTPKLRRRGAAARILLQNASAEDLPYRDATFDAATMAFGIRNVVRRERALAELHRVLRPGGRLLILDFSIPRSSGLAALYRVYFHRVLPFVGGLISGNFDAYRYLPRSVEGFPPRHRFAAMMARAGFERPRYRDLTFGIATLYEAEKPALPLTAQAPGRTPESCIEGSCS
ncbi:MAG: bifunctional demethylmenaquinone methyltransferase/2-methoxy-6-polyprenyl-1,4-benzoquinol methylase UbiE [Deltaproteobacteria bacterium]|nr:bifunctional demethylmenaquinone methyltransferase/2-methoxy-6-polyprenyl-1,4-benzoquinol methylase UbiE [Deltaproteobacteria bacterium]